MGEPKRRASRKGHAPPLMEVEWDDATAILGWTPDSPKNRQSLNRILTAGYLMRRTKDIIVLSQSYCVSNDERTEQMAILRSSVRSMRRLSPSRRRG